MPRILGDPLVLKRLDGQKGEISLHYKDGSMVPGVRKVEVKSDPAAFPQLVVTFNLHGDPKCSVLTDVLDPALNLLQAANETPAEEKEGEST